MPSAQEVAALLDELLLTSQTSDYPGAANGLQVDLENVIERVACAVDFSTRTIEGAAAAGANMLIVHHGLGWSGFQPIQGPYLRRLRLLLENGISVYSSHLPLDRHPEHGNNALLARELGLRTTGSFASYEGMPIGVMGTADIATAELIARAQAFAGSHAGAVRIAGEVDGRRTSRWAICTGAGASAETISEARAAGIDTMIVGEGPHWTAVAAEEENLTIIYAGHYATETLGVQSLGKLLDRELRIPWVFIEGPTGL